MNVGAIDSVIRFSVTMFFMIAVMFIGMPELLFVGGFILLTALTGHCPLYSVLGIDTCERHKNSK